MTTPKSLEKAKLHSVIRATEQQGAYNVALTGLSSF